MAWATISHGRRRPSHASRPESTTGPQAHLKLQGSTAMAITPPIAAAAAPRAARWAARATVTKP